VLRTERFLRLKPDVAWQCDAHIDALRLVSGDVARLPSRPVDVFRDLGMTEETITTYVLRWNCAAESAILQ
jgi:hypothetical protein